MKYVDLLQSISNPDQNYVGLADDLRTRLKVRNAGGSPHTSKFRPWRLVTYVAFSDPAKAVALRGNEIGFWQGIRQEASPIGLQSSNMSSHNGGNDR